LNYVSAGRERWVCDAMLVAASDPDAAVRALAVDRRLSPWGDQRAIGTLIERRSGPDLSVGQNTHKSLRMLARVNQGPDPVAWKAWRRKAR
jgi:hypothetical protein